MAPLYVGGAHGHNVISIVSVIKEEHVLLCKDTFNPQGLGFRASCILNMHDYYACILNMHALLIIWGSIAHPAA